MRLFRLSLIVLFTLILDVAFPLESDAAEALVRMEESLQRPQQKTQRITISRERKTASRFFTTIVQPIRKTLPSATAPARSPEEH